MAKNNGDTFEFTPGPWHAHRVGKVTFSDWSGWFIQPKVGVGLAKIATLDDVDFGPLSKGNALLIAAAPDLLSELRDFHDHTIDQGWHDCEGIPGGCPVVAAIRKAEGKANG